MILSVNNITKSFGTDVILSEVSFHIEAGQKAAIVGINGAGKSTLLKIITGELAPDSGTVSIQKDATIGILTQTQNLTDENSIYDEVLSVKADILALEENIRRTEHSLKNLEGEELEQALNRYSRMNAEFENANGYAVKSEVTGVLKGLGFGDDEFSKTVGTLSGGQKTRVALAKLLLTKPDATKSYNHRHHPLPMQFYHHPLFAAAPFIFMICTASGRTSLPSTRSLQTNAT